MAATFTVEESPATNGLGGHGAPLGLGLLKRVTLALTGGTVAGTVLPAAVGCSAFLQVIGLVSRTAGVTSALTAFSATTLTVTSSASSSSVELLVLCQG